MRLTARQYLHRLGNSLPSPLVYGISFIVGTIILSTAAIQSDSKADVATDKAVTIAGSLSVLCHAGNDLAALLQSARTTDGKPLCPEAEEIRANPTAEAAAPVSDAHIVSLIRDELAKEQPATATPEPMTLEQVTAAARAVMMTNQVLFKGEKGDKGDPPSKAELDQVVAQAVAAYFRANAGSLRGERGPTVTRTERPEPTTVTRDPPAPPTVTHTETQTVNPDPGPSTGDQQEPPPAQDPGTTNRNGQGLLPGLLGPN